MNTAPAPRPSVAARTLEILESRIAPAIIFAIDNNNNLLVFDSATPNNITLSTPITGLVAAGEKVQAIDFRPATGELYALGIEDTVGTDTGRLYTINTLTAVATQVGAAPFSTTLANASSYGFDFDPQTDQIRLVSRADENLRLSPTTGVIAGTDIALDKPGANEDVVAIAYTQNFAGAGQTTLFGYDFALDDIVRIGGVNGGPPEGSPNQGVVTKVGEPGLVADSTNLGLDIMTTVSGDQAYAAIRDNGSSGLYTVALDTGKVTLVGAIGNGAAAIVDIAVTLPSKPQITIVNPTTATYLDVDGDLVTIKTSKGVFGGRLVIYPAGPNGVTDGGKHPN